MVLKMSDYLVTEYGTAADGVTNDGPAVQRAVDTCAAAGGGRVVVPAGRYLCGTIELKDHVELHLESGAVLVASLREEDIRQTVSPDSQVSGHSGFFVGAVHAKDVALTGFGELNGQGHFVMYDDGSDGGIGECPLYSEGFRPRLTYFEDVEDLTVRDVTMRDSSLWTLHLAGCRHVVVDSLKVFNDRRSPNTDGIDPDSCQDVLITGCQIETGDDAIVIKATGPMTRLYGPCENIVVRGCILCSHDSALKLGTETVGDIRNILMSDCIVKDCSRGVGILLRDGGTIENVTAHHITGAVRQYAGAGGRQFIPDWWGKGEPLYLSATYRRGTHKPAGTLRNIVFEDIRLKAESSSFFRGEADSVIEDVTVRNCRFDYERQGTQEPGLFDEQPSDRDVYPHAIPAFYANHVNGLHLDGVKVRWHAPRAEAWSGLAELENCRNVRFDNVREEDI